jgi:hypothetical protein
LYAKEEEHHALHCGGQAAKIFVAEQVAQPGLTHQYVDFADQYIFHRDHGHARGLVLPGDLYGDEPVAWRLWHESDHPEYQFFGLDQLDAGI